MTVEESVWIFTAPGGLASAVFCTRQRAEEWISRSELTGMLTKTPVDISVYDWAIREGLFKVKKDHEDSPEFIARFTTASQEHYHYEDGKWM